MVEPAEVCRITRSLSPTTGVRATTHLGELLEEATRGVALEREVGEAVKEETCV